ncbi:MAG: 3-phosphoshikimate 1-carboxyvinyltransferase [Succinivibrio sp.]|nr:3-phosphoshikimate 1-carboxyvinyltransferase [Succinivibrio sp.]
MNSIKLKKIQWIDGKITLPGSKSLSNRALLLSALAKGRTRLLNVLDSNDTRRMLEALKKLHVRLDVHGSTVDVEGLGGPFDEGLNRLTLDLGNAGTAMRPLCAALAISDGVFVLTGESRMMERPIGPLTEALKELGLNIEYLNNDGYPPVQIWGHKADKHEVSIDGSISSQFTTALLMIAPVMGGLKLHIKGDLISRPYVDMTIKLMDSFGCEVRRTGYSSFEIPAGNYRSPGNYFIEGDATGATYFSAAAAVAGKVEIFGIGSESGQGDLGFLNVLEKMGARVSRFEDYVVVEKGEGKLRGIEIDMNNMPDAAMTLVPLALFTDGPVTVRNIASWRVKETDRIAAMAAEMCKLGVKVDSGSDYISIDASTRNDLTPVFDTYNDHRMAMCMSLVALDRDIEIKDPDCVKKTFPNYFSLFSTVTH